MSITYFVSKNSGSIGCPARVVVCSRSLTCSLNSLQCKTPFVKPDLESYDMARPHCSLCWPDVTRINPARFITFSGETTKSTKCLTNVAFVDRDFCEMGCAVTEISCLDMHLSRKKVAYGPLGVLTRERELIEDVEALSSGLAQSGSIKISLL